MARWHAIQVAARMEGLAWSVLSIWSDTNKVENIKLFRRHRAATSNQWQVQADNVTSRTFVYIQTQHGGEANCSCVWAQTRANRSSNWAPVSLRYRWNRSSPRWSSWRDSEITPALCVSGGLHEPGHDSGWFFCISGTCTAGTVHTGDISHDRRGMTVIEKYQFKNERASVLSLFLPWASRATSANDANSPKWSSGAIKASQVIVFTSIAFGLNAP